MQLASKYIQERDGDLYVGDSRVQVYSVIASWQQGYSPEETQYAFPHLSLVDIYGTITYYLEHRAELDAHFRELDARFAQRKAEAEAKNPEFYAMMREQFARMREEWARSRV
jgi:uncharacterized protein (DUF433 family)